MILVASANGNVGMAAGMDILRAGGSALDAVEAATKLVELNEDDHTVGVGGYPNLLGEMELDASIMDGATRRAGAVAALKNYPHPISVARAILEHLPQHILLVGDGAARFAQEQNFATAEILTPFARDAWGKMRAGLTDVEADALSFRARQAHDPEKTAGTVNILAQDKDGRIASAVSTSGWAYKYPGRAGDSPIIGAGNYCDDRFGACACTGLGEWAIRASLARMVVAGLANGETLTDACKRGLEDLRDLPLPPSIESVMSLVAIDKNGNHAAFSTAEGREYVWQTPDMAAYETTARTVVA